MGKKALTYEAAVRIPALHRFVWLAIRHAKKCPVEFRCGSVGVIFPDGRERQLLVMQQGRFKEPIMAVSNCLDTRRETVVRLCSAYLRRWAFEEAIRAIKQVFDLENLRALTWAGIRLAVERIAKLRAQYSSKGK